MQKSDQHGTGLRWSVTQRLEFIEFRLVWEGRINRSDISSRFGIALQQASADLQQYDRLAPTNLDYDRNAKTFVPSSTFEPVFLRPLANRQLLQLAALANGLVDRRETWFSDLPPAAVVPSLPRSVPTATVRWILEAIRAKSVVEVGYHSLSGPTPIRRSLAPHALGFDGHRWHARAWCFKNREFRDFVLSRISEVATTERIAVDASLDVEWTTNVNLDLGPHPELGEPARRALAKEHNMSRGRLRLPVRVAMAFYTIKHLNLDLNLSPPRQQLVLLNQDEVNAACADARAKARDALQAAEIRID